MKPPHHIELNWSEKQEHPLSRSAEYLISKLHTIYLERLFQNKANVATGGCVDGPGDGQRPKSSHKLPELVRSGMSVPHQTQGVAHLVALLVELTTSMFIIASAILVYDNYVRDASNHDIANLRLLFPQ